MIEALDHIVLAVADLDAATAAYGALLGRAASWRGAHPAYGTRNTLFRLDNTYLELLAADQGATSPLSALVRSRLGEREERPLALALGIADIAAAVAALRRHGLRVGDPAEGAGVDTASGRRRTWRNALVDSASTGGLQLILIQHTSPADLLPSAPDVTGEQAACNAVDHVVVFTGDLDEAIRFWTEVLGLEVQWRRDFPERGTRNVGLDLAGITLELIMRTDRASTGGTSRFWGVAYEVSDCDRAVTRVRATGLDITDAHAGLAPDTRVATLRWPRTPTLLIARLEEARSTNGP